MLYQSDSRSAVQSEPKHSHLTFMWSEVSWYPPRLPSHGNCSRHDRSGSRTAQHRLRWGSCVAQPSAVRLRWTQRRVQGVGASSGCYIDVARASTGAVSDTIRRRWTPRRYAPISTPTDVTRPTTRPGSFLGPLSINRWAPACQRTENTASPPPDAPSQD
jgi:hypothetical protein